MPAKKKTDQELEQYFAQKWGTPEGLMMLVVTFGIFLISIGIFIWLLHVANVIK